MNDVNLMNPSSHGNTYANTSFVKEKEAVHAFLCELFESQNIYESKLNIEYRKKNGIFLTNSHIVVENILDIIKIDKTLFLKKVIEPSCGQGILILKLLSDIYFRFPSAHLIKDFISKNLYFIDIQSEMIKTTEENIKKLYRFLFDEDYLGSFNSINWDFTDKRIYNNDLCDSLETNPYYTLYNTFDYVIGNPPYVSLYGRRDKKVNEAQRVRYLENYAQFPNTVKDGKINLSMLFLEHALDFLKPDGKLSFIIDISFFETAYQYTRKYLLENAKIDELQVNIKSFDVASGQVILKLTKTKKANNEVKITDHKKNQIYYIEQSSWQNKDDEYKFRYNGCKIFKQISDKVNLKNDTSLSHLFPDKNLRTCAMLLDMEDKFTFSSVRNTENALVYPYYQGSKSLSEKYGKLTFNKYFKYDKILQDEINQELKLQLEKQGIKNKKRIGLGESIVYDNPKVFIRQSAKEIIATIDFGKSAGNNSLYVFSLRNNFPESINYLYFLCGFLNSDFVSYYAQQMGIIRFSQGKQPQIKISDLSSIRIPEKKLQYAIGNLCENIYSNQQTKQETMGKINELIYDYYNLTSIEINAIQDSIKDF